MRGVKLLRGWCEGAKGGSVFENIVYKLVENFPNQIIGVKDSSYNLFEKIKIENFSLLPGSESKLLKGLDLGCSGIITATTNATASLAREVYDNFINKREQTLNDKLCEVRAVFEKYNLISSLHTFFSQNDQKYKYILPPLRILNETEKNDLLNKLDTLGFKNWYAAS